MHQTIEKRSSVVAMHIHEQSINKILAIEIFLLNLVIVINKWQLPLYNNFLDPDYMIICMNCHET